MAESVSYIIQLKDKFSRTAKAFNSQMKNAKKSVDRAAQSLKKFGAGMKRVGSTMMTRVTAPIVAGAAATILAFSKMEKGLVNVQTLLSDDQISKYGDQLERLQRESIKAGFTIDDTNKGFFNVISALGLSTNSMKAFQEAQRLAIAGDAELAASVLGIGKVMNVWGKETTDVTKVVNAFFTAQKVGSTDVQSLALNIGKVSGGAKVLGLSFQDALSTLSIVSNALKNTEEAGTALSSIFTVLNRPTEEAKPILTHLGIAFGVTAVKAAGFANVLKNVVKAFKDQPDLLTMAIPNIQAFKGLATLTDESLEMIGDTVKQIDIDAKLGTGLGKAFDRQSATMDRTLKRMRGSVAVAFRDMGVSIAPFVIKLSEGISRLADRISGLSPSTKKILVIFAGLLAISGPLLLFFGTMISIMGSMALVATAASIPLGVIAGVFLGLPILIAAVVAGLVVLQKKFQIFDKVASISRGLTGGMGSMLGIGGKVGDSPSKQIEKAASGLTGGVSSFLGFGAPSTSASSTQDVSGTIKVEATKGSKVAGTKSFNPNIGLNAATVF